MINVKKIWKQILVFMIILGLIAPWFLGCNSRKNTQGSGNSQKIMIAGSTSMQPIVEKLAEHYMKSHGNIKIEVQGGGSSAGIQAARTGAAQIGTSSRELKKEEKEQDTAITIMAYDAIVLIVHPENSISNINIEQVRKIFSYECKNWEELECNQKGQITMITREEGSGTRGAFEEMVMHKTEIAERCLVQDSTGAVREIVANDPCAIGYISFGALNSSVKALSINGVFPKMENFTTTDINKKYKLIRPFLFVTQHQPAGLALDFIKYIRSSEAANLLKQEGLIPYE